MFYRLLAVFRGVALALLFFVPAASRAGAADDRFTLADKNRDGLLDWEEFSAINPQIIRRGFDIIDSGGDGTISREEWRAFSDSHGMDVPAAPASRNLPLVLPPGGSGGNDASAPSMPRSPNLPLISPPDAEALSDLKPEPSPGAEQP